MAEPDMEEEGRVSIVGAAAVTLVSLVLVMALVEAASRVLLPNLYFVWPPNFSMVFDAGSNIAGVQFPSQLTINSQGMRGDPLDGSHTYRVLAIGGSTTICVYLDDERVWPKRVQSRLNDALGAETVWVGNAGRPGHMTTEHVLQVEALLSQHPEIDAVMLLIGVNDLIRHLPKANRPDRIEPPKDPKRALRMAFSFYPGWDDDTTWYKRNIVARVWQMANWHPWGSGDSKQLRPEDAKGEFVAMMRDFRQNASGFRPQLPDLQSGRAAYAERVNQIVDITQRAGVDVLLMTQPVLWRSGLSTEENKLLWGGGPPLGKFRKGAVYYSVEALADGMQLYNETLLAVCKARGIRCLDLASVIPRTTEVFYDDAHFTEFGSDLVSEVVTAHLMERDSFREGVAATR
jgi:lysophospholipase L1-like esterase